MLLGCAFVVTDAWDMIDEKHNQTTNERHVSKSSRSTAPSELVENELWDSHKSVAGWKLLLA